MIYIYDGTFEGILTVVFEIYRSKKEPQSILHRKKEYPALFEDYRIIETDTSLSERVFKGVSKKLSPRAINNLFKVMLTEKNEAGMIVYQYIRHALSSRRNIESDYAHDAVLQVKQLVKMIGREVHRMHAFVRFKLTKDGVYAATINPDFDVIPLIGNHFRKRYADQRWLIYDTIRGYGLYYDLKVMEMIEIEGIQLDKKRQFKESILADDEVQFQALWKTYFQSTNIKERENLKLHLRHVPKRYWQFLVEKN